MFLIYWHFKPYHSPSSQAVQWLHVFVFFIGFIQFFLLCLSLCRSGAAYTDVNEALLRRLSEWTPATPVAVWTEKLLYDFQKPMQSHSMECGSQFIVSGFRENHMTDQIEMVISLENKNSQMIQGVKIRLLFIYNKTKITVL